MDLLLQIEKGQLTARQAHQKLQTEPAEDDNEATTNITLLESFANLDHGRSRRTGFPEAIFAAGKTPEQIAAILDNMAHHVNSSIPAVRQTVEETTASLLSHNNNNAGSAILATRYVCICYLWQTKLYRLCGPY
jgi:NCAIR mutase (PurE)-related protein